MRAGTFARSAEGSFVGQSPCALPLSPCTTKKSACSLLLQKCSLGRHVQACTHTHTCRLPACSPNFPVSPTFLSPFLFEPLLNLLDLKATLHLWPSRGEACTIKSHKVFWSPTQTPQPKPQTSNLQPKGEDTSCSREGRLFKSEHRSALWSAHSLMLRGRSVSSEFGN